MTYNRGNVYVKNHIFYDVRSFVSAVRSDDVDGCFFFAWEALGCWCLDKAVEGHPFEAQIPTYK